MKRETEDWQTKASRLPIEEIVWTVCLNNSFEAEDSEDEDGHSGAGIYRLVEITDTGGAVVAMTTRKPSSVSSEEQVTCCLHDAFLVPLSGQPRRPRWVIFKDFDPFLHDMLELHLSSVDIEVVDVVPPHICCTQPVLAGPVRACSTCHRTASQHMFVPCAGCGVVFYCSDTCEHKAASQTEDRHSHRLWCDKMKQYHCNNTSLAKLPFTYTQEVTSEDFDRWKLMRFLHKNNIFDKGLWRREWLHTCSKMLPPYGELKEDGYVYGLPDEEQILSTPPSSAPAGPLQSWAEYYAWRGFSLSSPVAVLLSGVMTVYHIITALLPQHYPDNCLTETDTLNIHLVGAEHEVESVQTFVELQYLLPSKSIHITMVGPEISKKVHSKSFTIGKVQFSIQKAVYHNWKGPKPDIVIGLNSGLGAYKSWTKTLKKLKETRVPTYFTDFCRYSCECSLQAVEGLGLGSISEPSINPFRSPTRIYCEDHTMPWYSNAFVFTLTCNADTDS